MAEPVFMETKTEWDFYFCTIEDRPASIMLDLALSHLAPMPEKSEFVQVTIHLNHPNEHGLTSPGEAEVLYIVEDRMSEHLAKTLGGIYAGRNTSAGQRIFYFYCNSSIDCQRIVGEVMEGFGTHSYEVVAQRDPEWAFYTQFLYPSQLEYQSILNRRVVENLEKQGDDLSAPREIEHFLYFPTSAHRNSFTEKIEPENFRIVNQSYDAENDELPYALVIGRSEKIDLQAMDETVMFLILQSAEEKGEYDGWATAVLKSEV